MLVAELIYALASLITFVALAAMALLQVLVAIVAFGLELVLSLVGRRRASSASALGPEQMQHRRRVLRYVGFGSAGSLAIMMLVVVLLNTVWFDWSVRRIASSIQSRTGIAIDYAEAQGNLLRGRLEFSDVTLRRSGHPASNFDLSADRLMVDLNVWSMLGRHRRVEVAEISGLRGEVVQVGKTHRDWFSRKRLTIHELTITDAQVSWSDHTTPSRPVFALALDSLSSRELRSHWVAWDLLLRTSATGQIADGPFEISNSVVGGRREALWSFRQVPATALGDYVGGPFAWLEQGAADVDVALAWDPQRATQDLHVNCSFVFWSVRMSLPPSLQNSRMATMLASYVNQRGGHLPLAFELRVDESGFEGAASLEAAGLWNALVERAAKSLNDRLGIPAERVQELRDSGAEALQRFRRNRTERESPPEGGDPVP